MEKINKSSQRWTRLRHWAKITWLDRIGLYRLAALTLLPLWVRSFYRTFTQDMSWTWWRVPFWVGFIALLIAVYRDYREVRRGRLKIEQSIEQAIQKNQNG